MLVILKRDVKGSGKAGDVVKVSDGYARNMLIPKGYAVEATKGNVRSLEKIKAQQAEEEEARRQNAQKQADAMKEQSIEIKTKAGEGGRLFGSITAKDIAEAINDQLGFRADKKVKLDSPIKSLGTFTVEVKLYHDIRADLTVKVTEE